MSERQLTLNHSGDSPLPQTDINKKKNKKTQLKTNSFSLSELSVHICIIAQYKLLLVYHIFKGNSFFLFFNLCQNPFYPT